MSNREALKLKYMSSFGFALNDQEAELVRGAYHDGWSTCEAEQTKHIAELQAQRNYWQDVAGKWLSESDVKIAELESDVRFNEEAIAKLQEQIEELVKALQTCVTYNEHEQSFDQILVEKALANQSSKPKFSQLHQAKKEVEKQRPEKSARKIEITTCSICPHHDHQGAFGEVAYIPQCAKTGKELPYNTVNNGSSSSGKPLLQAQSLGTIPQWCPLKKDEKQNDFI